MKLSTTPLGFTLVEILVATSLLAITVALTGTYLLAGYQKAQLDKQTNLLIDQLEYARQNSIVAVEGNAYGVRLDPQNSQVQVLPGNRVKRLNPNIKVEYQPEDYPNLIEFETVTGYPTAGQVSLRLQLNDYVSHIYIDEFGYINQTPIRKI